MPRTRKPRAGSMQYWPRVRSKCSYARIRSWSKNKETKPLGFAGYKVGMTHSLINDNIPHSMTKGSEIFCPVTVVECPPIKTISIIFYINTKNGQKQTSQIFTEKLDKEVGRKITFPKKRGNEPKDFDFIRLLCHTQPSLTGIGKKKPEIFEIALGGNKDQQLEYAKGKLGKEITVDEVFKEGQQIDTHSLTKGKGFQGPVRRFGVHLRQHKSEKSRRNPGSLGAWKSQGHIMWRTAHAGKTGYNSRTEYNKWILKITDKYDEIRVKGGFVNYGFVKSKYILVKGSIPGASKRLIRFIDASRPKKNMPTEPQIAYISIESKQGR